MRKTLLAIAITMLLSCRTSFITDTWKADEAGSPRYDKVLVLALTRDEDRNMQRKMEQHMVDDLKELGYKAVTSINEFGPNAFWSMTEKEAVNKVKNGGIDAVITIVLLRKNKETRYYPNHPQNWPFDFSNQGFGYYSQYTWKRILEPGYYVTNTRYFWESNLYNMDDDRLIYSVQTETFDPVSAEAVGHEYGKMIVKNMARKNVLRKQELLKAF